MGYYSYQMEAAWDSRQETISVLYYHRDGAFATPLGDTIDQLLNRRLPPSRVLIISPPYATGNIIKEFRDLPRLALERLRVTHQVLVLSYGCNGRLATVKVLRNDEKLCWRPSDDDLAEIARTGVKQLVDDSGTLLKAPAGYYFRKPSHNLSNTFIRAGNMFKTPEALALIHHLLLRAIPPHTKQLYIDSVTILPIALYFRAECLKLSETCKDIFSEPAIINFHSYDLDPNLRFPGHVDYFVLISASSSGSLRKRLEEKHGASLEKIIHLLGISSNPAMAKCSLYYEEDDPPQPLDSSNLKEINIPSEEFVASHGEARAVTISKAHVSNRDRHIYSEPALQPLIEFRLGGSYEEISSPIGITFQHELTPDFTNWLKDELAMMVPNNVTHLVIAGSKHAITLGREVERQLNQTFRQPVVPVELAALMNGSAKLTGLEATSVLIVCDEEGPGDRLLAASRMLREYRNAHRHYLIGFCFPESRSSYQRLVSNLTTSGQRRRYGWSIYHIAPVGAHRLHTAWQTEADFITNKQVTKLAPAQLRTALEARAKDLLGPSMRTDRLFLPTFSGTTLTLRPDSIFFKSNTISQVSVYLAISSVMQRARDGRDEQNNRLADEFCFDNSPFIDTVLDPDMFSRFNDGVIQAAFLRACAVDELNYSRNRILSKHMAGIVKSSLLNRRNANGEAALEFMFALSQHKIRLESTDLAEVLETISGDPELNAVRSLFSESSIF